MRAVDGGLGGAKTGANYAASLMAGEEAKHEGFTQVLWLDGVHRKYIDEVGTMNIMVQIGDEVITPPLARDHPARRDARLGAHAAAQVGPQGRASGRSPSTRWWHAHKRGHAQGGLRHGDGRRHLARGRARLQGPAHGHQRRRRSARSPSGSTTPSWASSTARRRTRTAGRSRSSACRLRLLQDQRRPDPVDEDRRGRAAPSPSWTSTRSARATAWWSPKRHAATIFEADVARSRGGHRPRPSGSPSPSGRRSSPTGSTCCRPTARRRSSPCRTSTCT